ncbi:hypothetical protein HanPI659440_Chr13g0512771 [Helianthus annuus]|nr:hypothetical protein HanPI659440_Chr13g0512771 [Helianthus annuus]
MRKPFSRYKSMAFFTFKEPDAETRSEQSFGRLCVRNTASMSPESTAATLNCRWRATITDGVRRSKCACAIHNINWVLLLSKLNGTRAINKKNVNTQDPS